MPMIRRHPSSLSVVTDDQLALKLTHPVHFLESTLHCAPIHLRGGGIHSMMSRLCELLAAADMSRSAVNSLRSSEDDGHRSVRAARAAQASHQRLNRAIYNMNLTWRNVKSEYESSINSDGHRHVLKTRSIPSSARASIICLMGAYTLPEAYQRRMKSALYLVQKAVFRESMGWGWGGDTPRSLLPDPSLE